jgi:hypothetical protein
MQVKNWVLATATIAVLASCGDAATSDDNKTDSSGTTNTTVTTETKTKTVEVPVATRTSFEAKYPQASDIEWQYHSPEVVVPIEWEWVEWKIDTTDYVANFKEDNTDYWVWYDDSGDWIGTVAEVTDYAGLPAAVNKTVKSQFAGYTIVSVDKENDKNRTAYEIKMENGPDKMKALIGENGQVYKKKGKVDGEKVKEKNNPKDSA